MSRIEKFPFVDKLWESVDEIMNKAKDSKKTCQEIKSTVNNLNSTENSNMQSYNSCAKKIGQIPETKNLISIWNGLEEVVNKFSWNAKALGETLTGLISPFNTECEIYVSTLEQNRNEMPPVRKAKENALIDVLSAKEKYNSAFEDWDKLQEEYEKLIADKKDEKKINKAKEKADQKKTVADNKLETYKSVVDSGRKAQETYTQQMTTFLKNTQNAESKRLKAVVRILTEVCVAYQDLFTKNKQLIDNLLASLQKVDDLEEINSFANAHRSKERAKAPVSVVLGVRKSEKGKTRAPARTRGPAASSSRSSAPSMSQSSSSGRLPAPRGKPPTQKRSYIPVSHPLIVYASYEYSAPPPDNSGEPVMDVNEQPLEKGFNEVSLKANNAYLLRRGDYPWQDWCTVVPLEFADTQTAGGEDQLYVPDPQAKNLVGGYAPANYFYQENVDPAKEHLQANPTAAADALAQLKNTVVAASPVSTPPRRSAVSSSIPSSSSSMSSPGKSKRSFLPDSHPLIIYANYDYDPPAATGEALTDINNLPLEPGFVEITLKANYAYLLRQNDYPWADWCTVIPLEYASAEEATSYYATKGGTPGELFYLASPSDVKGGYAPANYLNEDYAGPAKQHLLSNPSSITDAIRTLSGEDGRSSPSPNIPPPPPVGSSVPPPPPLGSSVPPPPPVGSSVPPPPPVGSSVPPPPPVGSSVPPPTAKASSSKSFRAPPPPPGDDEDDVPPPPPGGGGAGAEEEKKKHHKHKDKDKEGKEKKHKDKDKKRKSYTVEYAYTDEESGIAAVENDILYVPEDSTEFNENDEWLLLEDSKGVQGFFPANRVRKNW